MHLLINKNQLAKVLNNISRIANSRNQLPILNNVLLRAEKDKLTIIANNLELASEETIPTTVKQNGVITVPAKPLAEFINNLPNTELSLETTGTKLKVSGKGFSATFNGVDAEDFPEVINPEAKSLTINLSVADFRHTLQQVISATSNDFSRPALTGVCFNSFNKQLFVVATDGFRLAEAELLPKFNDDLRVIVPTAAITEVLSAAEDGDLTIKIGEAQIQFLIGEQTEITSNLISGSYPDYRQLIAATGAETAVVDRDELIRLLKVAQVFARVADNAVILKTSGKNKQLSVIAVESELGSNSSEMAAAVSGTDISMAFNIRFLLDALNVFEAPEVNLDFSDDKLIIHGNDSSSLVYIVMPRKA
ncbi:MAG: DNA polymerase III subunit beta [Candidatus Nomurabacteria bacterium]|jgi:DNA polymerase-3 subunit beta|nr:DNA polymerase III subunit beta [Candidatus Nomurabacteria bacterium]